MIRKSHATSKTQRSVRQHCFPTSAIPAYALLSPTPMLCCLYVHSLLATSDAYCWYPSCAKSRIICRIYWAALPHSLSNFSDHAVLCNGERLTSTRDSEAGDIYRHPIAQTSRLLLTG